MMKGNAMLRFNKLVAVSMSLFFAMPAAAQTIVLKPFYGYVAPRLTDVNNQIESQITGWENLLGVAVPSPGKIDGSSLIGGRVQHHFNDEYFIALDFSRYEQEVTTDLKVTTGALPFDFLYQRDVETFEAVLNLGSYFRYDSERRWNIYIEFGAGLLAAKARSTTTLTYTAGNTKEEAVATYGTFSRSTLAAMLATGLEWRLTGAISLWGTAGYRYAKVGRMEGTATRLNNNPNAAFTTNSSFDFSGFYFRTGLGLAIW